MRWKSYSGGVGGGATFLSCGRRSWLSAFSLANCAAVTGSRR
jgi:hypothetical protein